MSHSNLTDQLAQALRALYESAGAPCDCGVQGCGNANCTMTSYMTAQARAREALGQYDAIGVTLKNIKENAR